jgi:hypothetical protein
MTNDHIATIGKHKSDILWFHRNWLQN